LEEEGVEMRMIAVFLTVCLCVTGCVARPLEQADDAPRVIATSAAVCGILDKLDLRLVGVPETSAELPERYQNLTRVGLPMSPDMEIIKSLRPTDVITPNSLLYDLKPQYEAAGVSSTFVNLSSVEGMFKSIDGLGKKYNRQSQAENLLNAHKLYMDGYAAGTAGKENPRVLILMGIPGSYMAATEKSYAGNLVKLAGGVNVIPDGEAFLNLNTEALLKTDPDIILRAAHGMPDEVKDMFQKEFAENDIWKHFRAVRNGRVHDLDYSDFGMSASLSYTNALEFLYTVFYKDDLD
jgi:iron complex transport system substrate-binding protein